MVKSSMKVKYAGKTYILVGESTNSFRLTTGKDTVIVPKDAVELIKSHDVQDKEVAKTKKSRTRKG